MFSLFKGTDHHPGSDTDAPSAIHALDAAPVDEPAVHKPVVTPQPIVDVKPEKIPTKPDRQRKRHKPNKTNKTVKKPPEELLNEKKQANRRLYGRVGALLKKVKHHKGDAAVQSISRSYNAISPTRLRVDASVQAEYSATLKRLHRELRHKQKQK
ncbi:MAG: hypothetical protein JKY56_21595 [Kofleriaceae bacterium]|nr:hypothetical protein [Kofleriaceae bacterium]